MMVTSESELAEAIAGAKGPLQVVGGGTRLPVSGGVLQVGISGVRLYEPGALTLVVAAGTPLAEVEALLAGEGQRLAFEPMDFRPVMGSEGEPTIGGVVAANISGPRRVQAGACRDFLLGVRFVDGHGRVIKSGGRVMKNVTGYDLVKLMAGSWGTLGVLSEVSLKVLPAAEAVATVIVHGLDDVTAVKALSRALGSAYDVSGAAHIGRGDDARTLVRVEGFADSVAYRAGRLRELLGNFGEVSVEDDAARNAALWKRIRDVEDFAGRAGDVWRLSLKPSDGPVAAAALRAAFGAEVIHNWGGGLVWALVPEGADLRAAMGDLPGHARIIRASADTVARLGRFHPRPAPVAALETGLKEKFDPRGILNPGLMG